MGGEVAASQSNLSEMLRSAHLCALCGIIPMWWCAPPYPTLRSLVWGQYTSPSITPTIRVFNSQSVLYVSEWRMRNALKVVPSLRRARL